MIAPHYLLVTQASLIVHSVWLSRRYSLVHRRFCLSYPYNHTTPIITGLDYRYSYLCPVQKTLSLHAICKVLAHVRGPLQRLRAASNCLYPIYAPRCSQSPGLCGLLFPCGLTFPHKRSIRAPCRPDLWKPGTYRRGSTRQLAPRNHGCQIGKAVFHPVLTTRVLYCQVCRCGKVKSSRCHSSTLRCHRVPRRAERKRLHVGPKSAQARE